MKTRLLSVLGASVVLLSVGNAAFADGNQVIPGSDLIQTETYGFDGNGDYHAEDRTDYRELNGDSPNELRVGGPGRRVTVNTTADPKGCADDFDPSDCTGGAIGATVDLKNVTQAAVRVGSEDIQGGGGSAEVFAEDATNGDVLAGAINELAYATNPGYSTAGDDDDGHSCGNAEGHCDDETNLLISLP